MSGSAGVISISALNNWPGTVAYFQQRKVFAGSSQTPTGVWLTQPGNYKNMNTSVIPRDSDAITETIMAPPPGASSQVNEIRAMVSMPSGLLVFSAGGAWQITAGAQNGALTPATIQAQAHAFNGISDLVSPLPIGYELLFVQEKGSIVRDMSYNYYINVYTGTDMSALSNHLFFGRTIVSWCWAEEPFKLVWAVRDDGVLLSLTYLKEQEIYAWTRHDTNGLVEDVASVSEVGTDGVYVNAVYMVVRRLVCGVWRRYVERLASRNYGGNPVLGTPSDPATAWCVDSGLSYPRAYPAATLLPTAASGPEVMLNADAAVFAPGDVGKVIRGGGGVATITTYKSDWVVLANVTTPFRTLPNDPGGGVVPIPARYWSCTMPVTRVTGLDHLEGKTVAILADGNVCPRQVVVSGSVTLPQPASAIVVGLPFTWQLQTLPPVTPAQVTKGRRREVNAVTVIVNEARGIQVGPDWDSLTPIKDRPAGLLNGQATPLFAGEVHVNIRNAWTMQGQVCLQGDDPVPATILGVALDAIVGDT